MAGCPWYVPDAACEAAERACKEAVTPWAMGAGLILSVFLLTGVLQVGNFRAAVADGQNRRRGKD